MPNGPGFAKAEGTFKRPEGYRDYLAAEGAKQAAYLSSMDQFYAQLGESSRQFDLTLGYKQDVLSAEESMFGAELAQSSQQFADELAFEKSRWGEELGIREEQLEMQREAQSSATSLAERRLSLDEESLESQIFSSQIGRGGTTFTDQTGKVSEQEQFDFLKGAFGEKMDLEGRKIKSGEVLMSRLGSNRQRSPDTNWLQIAETERRTGSEYDIGSGGFPQ